LTKIDSLVKGILERDDLSISKAITIVENDFPESNDLLIQLYPHTGKAAIIGITGPAGSGKSTLVGQLIREYRKMKKTVGVVAVDPTSPFTGGAFLGDRIRMQDYVTGNGVFIRSMATRGNLGGLAKTTKDVVRILDASGKDIVIVETVGVGQAEVGIISVAHTTVLLFAPGLGDEIQALKAGLSEIGDVFVVNKADRENAEKTVNDINSILNTGDIDGTWRPPIIKTIAITGEGTEELINLIDQHREYLKTGVFERRLRKSIETELIEEIKQKFTLHLTNNLKREVDFKSLVNQILKKEIDPYTAAELILRKITIG